MSPHHKAFEQDSSWAESEGHLEDAADAKTAKDHPWDSFPSPTSRSSRARLCENRCVNPAPRLFPYENATVITMLVPGAGACPVRKKAMKV